jgi:FixJ family two-component response regulator
MSRPQESRERRSDHPIVSVVDDDLALLDAVADLIESAGYQTYKFSGAEAFLNSGAAKFSDLLITDIHMDGLDGLTLMDRVADVARLPVIIVTGQSENELRVRATSKGCAAFLRKPFDPASLLCHVEAAIRQA